MVNLKMEISRYKCATISYGKLRQINFPPESRPINSKFRMDLDEILVGISCGGKKSTFVIRIATTSINKRSQTQDPIHLSTNGWYFETLNKYLKTTAKYNTRSLVYKGWPIKDGFGD